MREISLTHKNTLQIMKKEKRKIVLNGNLLYPLIIGQGAVISAGGRIYRTSTVIANLEQLLTKVKANNR